MLQENPTMHNLMRIFMPMAGCDCHMEIDASTLVPIPICPHVVLYTVAGTGFAAYYTTTVLADGWAFIQRDSDIGPLIPHIPIPITACTMVSIIMLCSGSKSYFGAAKVQADGKPVAAALQIFVNPQLNCWDPPLPPMPSGVVFTYGTVVVGLTIGDVIGGYLSMGFDLLVEWGLNVLGGKLGNLFIKKFFPKVGAIAAGLIGNAVNAIMQQLTGSPVGWTWAPLRGDGSLLNPGNWGTAAGHGIGDGIDSLTGDYPALPGPVSRSIESIRRTLGMTYDAPSPSSGPSSTSSPGSSSSGSNSIVNDPGVEEL